MATYFKAGTTNIVSGSTEMTVTGLALDFTPGAPIVKVRQPVAESDLIDAYVVGAPTTDGFTVAFSSPVPTDGYKLDWIVSSAGAGPVDTGTLAADYTTIKNEVAHFLGYDASSLTSAQIAEVDRYIQGGIRQFYYPPAMEGVDPNFEWDFLKQNGSVILSAGTCDYILPDGFNHFEGHLTFSDPQARQTVPVIPYGELLRMLNAFPTEYGRPKFAAEIAQNAYGEKGQRRKLFVFPRPDREYTLQFTCTADTGKIDESVRPFPCGGPMYAELVIESCLAVAEQKANDEVGEHTAKFNQLLVSMIQKGRKSGAQVFGRVGDPDALHW